MTHTADIRPSTPAGPGPSGPAGPRPTPTHPRPSSPPPPGPPTGADSDPREAHASSFAGAPAVLVAAGVGPLPRLGEVIRDAERLGEQMIATLGRHYDPGSVSDSEAWPGMLMADLNLSSAVANVRQALRDLADLAKLRHPPVGSAVPVMRHEPDRPGAPGLPPRPLATCGLPAGSHDKAHCFLCSPRASSW